MAFSHFSRQSKGPKENR